MQLTFRLPPALAVSVPRGRWPRCLDYARVDVDLGDLVTVTAPSVKGVQQQTVDFLRAVTPPDHPPMTIQATQRDSRFFGERDRWTIVVGADVAFAPTGMGADVFTFERGQGGGELRIDGAVVGRVSKLEIEHGKSRRDRCKPGDLLALLDKPR